MSNIAGVDEVGRGSLVGPVYAAAVILKKSINKRVLKDSKKLSKSKRETLARYIKKNSTWAITKASSKEIDKINVLQASLLAMKRAIIKLKKKPSLVLIDGNQLPKIKGYKLNAVIKGDQKIPSISAFPLTSNEPASNSPVNVIFLKLAMSLFASTTTVFDATTVPAEVPSLKLSSVAVDVISVPPISKVVTDISPATVATPLANVKRSVSSV